MGQGVDRSGGLHVCSPGAMRLLASAGIHLIVDHNRPAREGIARLRESCDSATKFTMSSDWFAIESLVLSATSDAMGLPVQLLRGRDPS